MALSDDLRIRLIELTEAARGALRSLASTGGEAILQHLIDPLPFAALVANNEGRFVVANGAASALTGHSRRELLKLSAWDLTPSSMEHDADVLWRAFLQQHEQSGVYPLVTKDGRILEVPYAARAHVLPGLHLSLLKGPG